MGWKEDAFLTQDWKSFDCMFYFSKLTQKMLRLRPKEKRFSDMSWYYMELKGLPQISMYAFIA